MNIVHISHTDVRYDSRILKEMTALNDISDFSLHGIGVSMNEGNMKGINFDKFQFHLINLKSRKFNISKNFRVLMETFEFFYKSFIILLNHKPNVIHCHDLTPLPVCVLCKYIFNSKLIYDAHELESNKAGITPFLSVIAYFFEGILLKSVDFFITVSPSIQNWYKKNFDLTNTCVILNSPLFSKCNPVKSKNYLRNKYNLNNYDEKIFIYVGFLSPGRGIEPLLDFFSNHNHHHLVLLGYGPLLSLSQYYSNRFSNIYVHHAVPHEKVVEITSSADYGFCLIENKSLSDYYSLPNKLFEYAFSGIPVIASDFPDISYLIKKLNLGVCCKDLDDFDSLLRNLSNKKFSHHSLLHHYSWEKQSMLLVEIYNYLTLKFD